MKLTKPISVTLVASVAPAVKVPTGVPASPYPGTRNHDIAVVVNAVVLLVRIALVDGVQVASTSPAVPAGPVQIAELLSPASYPEKRVPNPGTTKSL